jgi:hypothetical protein
MSQLVHRETPLDKEFTERYCWRMCNMDLKNNKFINILWLLLWSHVTMD